jgi:hypothetical protein
MLNLESEEVILRTIMNGYPVLCFAIVGLWLSESASSLLLRHQLNSIDFQITGSADYDPIEPIEMCNISQKKDPEDCPQRYGAAGECKATYYKYAQIGTQMTHMSQSVNRCEGGAQYNNCATLATVRPQGLNPPPCTPHGAVEDDLISP